MIVLGIESSCDDTGIALYDTKQGLISHILASQIKAHQPYGGVVPEIASREHSNHIVKLFNELIIKTKIPVKDINAVAYTAGPGLTGALMVGACFAHSFAQSRKIPTIPINHLEGHLFSAWLPNTTPTWPCLCLLASGGHTMIIYSPQPCKYEILGETLDDAAGEALDKTAKLLGLPYPGGAHLAAIAEKGNPNKFNFTIPLQRQKTLNFSFSGLKSAAHRHWKICDKTDEDKFNLAASFQNTVTTILAERVAQACIKTGCRNIIVAGGVSANTQLRNKIYSLKNVKVTFPALEYCTDNGAMIAAAGAYHLKMANFEQSINIYPRWPLNQS